MTFTTLKRQPLDPNKRIPASVQRYLNKRKEYNREMNSVVFEAKILGKKHLLGNGVKSHKLHRTRNGSTPITGTERASIFKKTCSGTVNLGDQRVMDWLHSNANASK